MGRAYCQAQGGGILIVQQVQQVATPALHTAHAQEVHVGPPACCIGSLTWPTSCRGRLASVCKQRNMDVEHAAELLGGSWRGTHLPEWYRPAKRTTLPPAASTASSAFSSLQARSMSWACIACSTCGSLT